MKKDKKTIANDFVFTINEKARKASVEQKKDIINGSIGILFDEDNKLKSFNLVDETLKNSSKKLFNREYSSVRGKPEFGTSIEKWIFDGCYENIKSSFCVSTIYTMGGTGALYLGFKTLLKKKDKVLVPTPCWGNYESIINSNYGKAIYYNMFANNNFNIEGLIKNARKILRKQKQIILLINDPCQNPTGYSLSKNEWKKLIDEVNKLNGKIILFLDIAYLNADLHGDFLFFLNNISKFNENIMILIAFSASKTFSIYGLRSGALLALSKKAKLISEFEINSKHYARAIWSSANAMCSDAIINLLSDNQIDIVRNEVNNMFSVLKERSTLLISLLNKNNIEHYPYRNGFFLTIKCNDAYSLAEKLMDYDIYLLPVSINELRIAICAIPLKKYEFLVSKISQLI